MKKSQLVVLSLIYLLLVGAGLFGVFQLFKLGISDAMSELEAAVEAEQQISFPDTNDRTAISKDAIDLFIGADDYFIFNGILFDKSDILESVSETIEKFPDQFINVRVSLDAPHGNILFVDQEFTEQGYDYKISYEDE